MVIYHGTHCHRCCVVTSVLQTRTHVGRSSKQSQFFAYLDGRIYEVPVSYKARSREEGKKLTAFDGLRVLRTLIRCRFF